MTVRSIFFVDPPAFCTTVEGLVAPALRGRPVAVAPPGADRATILALSPEAVLGGLERGMDVRLAKKRCPDLILVAPNPRLYARASRALHEILARYAPVIEPRWYGHAFLDLSGTAGLFGPAADVAARIRRESRERLGLPLSIGVAGNKLVSEAATTVAPMHLLEIARGGEADFLAPHPVTLLPDVAPAVRTRLDEYHLELIGEVARLTERQVSAVWGAAGRTLLARARGVDPRPVLPPAVTRQCHVSHTLASDTNDLAVLHPLLRRLGDRLAARLRRLGLVARRLTIAVRYADYTEARARVALTAECLDVEVWRVLRRGFAKAHQKRIAVREVAVTGEQLFDADRQLDLWDRPEPDVDRQAVLQRAIDTITTRWGRRGIERAPSLSFPLHREGGAPVTTRGRPSQRSRSAPSARVPRPDAASGVPSR